MTRTKNSSENFKDKLKYLKVAVDLNYLLNSLGFNITHKTSKEYRSACSIHGGDNSTAFRFNRQTRTWVCFTHKCHDIFGNDIIGLIQAVKGVNFMEAVSYLEDLVGTIDNYDVKWQEYKHKQELETFISDFNDVKYRPSMVTESCLKQFAPFRSARFIKDGFSKEVLDHFNIAGGYTDKKGTIRDIIPIYDDTGYLSAYSLRDIRDNVNSDDKYIITPGFDKNLVLYNLNNTKELFKEQPMILVEGFKSVWRLYEYGIYNVVAVMGSALTPGQLDLLYTYAYKGCVLMFDNDVAGISATVAAVKSLSGKFSPIMPIFITEVDDKGKGLDPSDLDKETIYNYLEFLTNKEL